MLTSDSNIRDQAYQFFIQEAVEFLQTLEVGLINLSQERNIPKVHELMRAAHSIKGGAASVGLMGIQQLAHQLEDCIRALYNEDVVVDAHLENLLLQAYDCLQTPLIQQIETGYHEVEAAIAAAEPIFAQLTECLGDAMLGDAAMPTTAELGIDIVQAIFAGDVGDGLTRLEQLLQTPNPQELVGEMRAQAEVFVGIGELVNLPGWVAIAQAILAALLALDTHPEQVQAMGLVAISDLNAAQQAVLAGDRVQGGSPSPELLQYALASNHPAPNHLSQSLEDSAVDDNLLRSTPEQFDQFFNLAVEAPSVIDSCNPEAWDLAANFSGDDFNTLDAFFDSALENQVNPANQSFTEPENPSDANNWQTFSRIADDLTTNDRWEELVEQTSEEQTLEEQTLEEPALIAEAPSLDTAIRRLIQGENGVEAIDEADDYTLISRSDTTSDAAISEATISSAETDNLALQDPTAPAEDETQPSIDTVIRELLQKAEESESTLSQLAASVLASTDTNPEIAAETIPAVANQSNASSSQSNPNPASASGNTVRVDLSRLERINNFVGELVTQENQIILQNQQLQTVIKSMTQRFGQFETLAKQIGTWSDRTQKEHAKLSQRREVLHQIREADDQSRLMEALGEDFDPLQMDSYSDLYEQAQEMVELIAQMNEGMHDITAISQQAQQAQRQQQQILKSIREDLLWARMLPLGDLLQRFPRMLRDLSTRHGKQVNLKLTGAQTLVDKSILQSLYDPLVHLLRNAFDHGVESPEIRLTQGKPAQATIEIRAYHRGNQTYIEISDDGQGINPDKLRSQIVAQNLLSRHEANGLTIEDLYSYLFVPGFSTAQKVSELSGRGVGLDAVQLQVRNLKGSIHISSQPGQGTTFTLRLPLTLTIANLLVFSIQSCLLALPVDTLQAIVSAPKHKIRNLRGEQILQWEDDLIPMYSPHIFLQHYPLPSKNLPEQFRPIPLPQDNSVTVLLLALEDQLVALQVDQILQEQELAIKPFGGAIPSPEYFYGCTILGNGLLVPVLDSQALLIQEKEQPPVYQKSTPDDAAGNGTTLTHQPISHLMTILVIDDSLTTRQTLALTLQKAGYRVVQAKDGREGLEQLKREPQIQAVFSDIEMPRMNGFEFLSQCRQQFSKEVLPVMMLTSRGGDRHRQIAQYMGANGYLTKPYLEQEVLNTLKSVMAESR